MNSVQFLTSKLDLMTFSSFQMHNSHFNYRGAESSAAPSAPQPTCRRPGCSNPVPRPLPGGEPLEYCSNECVVGQCKEVYSSWSGNDNNMGPTTAKPSPGGYVPNGQAYGGPPSPPLSSSSSSYSNPMK